MSEARVLEDPEFAAPQQPDLPPVIPAHDAMTEARLNGYGWGDILGHLSDAADTAIASGYHPAEITAYLGYQPQGTVFDRLSDNALRAFNGTEERDPSAGLINWKPETNQPELAGPLPPDLRQEYANAMVSGETAGPKDFAQDYSQAVGVPAIAPEVQKQLPSHEDLTDYSIATLAAAGYDPTPALVRQTRASMLDQFAQTGATPAEVHAEAQQNPVLAELMSKAKERAMEGETFSRGFREGFGEPSETAQDIMRIGQETGLFLPPTGTGTPLQAASQVLLGGAVSGADLALRMLNGIYHGFGDVALQAGVPRDIVAIPEAFPAGGQTIGMPHVTAPPIEIWKPLFESYGQDVSAAIPQAIGKITALAPEIPGVIKDLWHDEDGALNLWHGTPHLFASEPEEGAPFGTFKLAAIGTGEGAQAYGHGIYLAENKEIAEFYRDSLTDDWIGVRHEGPTTPLQNMGLQILNRHIEDMALDPNDLEGSLSDALESWRGFKDDTAARNVQALESLDPEKLQAPGEAIDFANPLHNAALAAQAGGSREAGIARLQDWIDANEATGARQALDISKEAVNILKSDTPLPPLVL